MGTGDFSAFGGGLRDETELSNNQSGTLLLCANTPLPKIGKKEEVAKKRENAKGKSIGNQGALGVYDSGTLRCIEA
jgi:hypothetical protein